MADKRILQERVVKFGITGLNEVYDAQKKIRDNAAKALKEQKELLALTKEGTEAYKAQQKIVEKANKEYERQNKLFQDLGKQANTVLDVINNKTVESGKKIDTAIKAIMKGVKSISFKGLDAGETEKLRQHIAGLVKDLVGLQAQSHSISTGFQDMTAKLKTGGLGVEELTRYVKTYEQSGKALADNYENSSQAFAKMGENATNAKIRLGQLDGSLLAVNKSSNAETLRAYIKGWQEVAQYSGASSEQIKRANENIAKADALMRELMQKRIDNAGKTNLAGREYYSPAQVREAVEYMKQLSTSEKLTTEEREKLNASIKRGDEYLKQLTLDQQRYSMTLQLGGKQMANIKTLSDASLASQKKYWTEMVANTERGTAEYNQYLSTLKAVTDEEQRRASTNLRKEGANLVLDVNKGQFRGTIQETEEAIKKMQEYKRTLSGDTEAGKNAIMATERAIATLNEQLAKTTTEAINGEKAFKQLGDAAKQGVDAVVAKLPRGSEELKKMRSDLEAYKKSLKNPDPSKLQQIETIFTAIDKKEREVAASEISWSKFQGAELKKRSLTELKRAYEVLKKEVEGMSPAQERYNEKAMRMKQINEQVKRLNSNMSHHVSSLENAASRLKNYVLIYFGFNAAMMKTRQVIQNIIELSDQMTNVQKVTQLATEDIEHMTNALQSLDTRTTNQQLMEMAEQAGKLGIATREGADGLVSFVKEGQKIINTLGDIGGAEAINELLKVNDVVNKNSQGLEKDLNKIGSAILNVGNNSKATYADVVEFTKRLGATGSVTGLTMEQIMGLGGAFSSLGESMERSATATQRVTLGIVSHTEAVAKSLNIGYDELDMLIQEGKTFEALTLVLKELGEQGPAVYDDFFKAIGGRNNVQARNAMALLSQHLQELNYQVALAEEGFEEGVLVTQEFERANNNLAGVVAQIGNEFYEMTTTVEGSNGALLTMAKWLLELTKSMRENNAIGGILIATLLVLTKTLIVSSKAWYENAAAAALNDTTYQGFKGTFFGLIQIVVQSIKWIVFQTQALLGSAAAADKAKLAAERLKIAWSSNWITLALVALGLLIGKLIATAKATSDARKSLGELIQKGEEEIAMLNSLYRSLQNVNLAQQDRTNKINTFNRLFGSYLSNILTEENVAKRLGVAYREAAAAIREKNAAALEEKAEQAAEEAGGENQREAIGLMMEGLGLKTLGPDWAKNQGLSSYDKSALVASIQAAVISAVEGGETRPEKIRQEVIRRLGTDQRFISTSYGSGRSNNSKVEKNLLTGDVIITDNGKKTVKPFGAMGQSKTRLQTALDDFIKATLSGQKAKEPFILQAGGQRILAQDEEIAMIGELRKEILEAKENAKTPRAQRELYNNIMQYRRMYNKYKGDSRLSSGEGSFYSQFENMLPELQKVVKPWGKTSIDMSGQAGKDMAIIVDYFNDIYNNWKEGQKILRTSAYKTPIGVTIPEDIDTWSKEQLRDWAYTNWQAAKKMQESENYDNPKGNFKDFTEKKGRKKHEIAKDEFEAAIAELDRYYKDRETLIEIALNNEEITESEANRRKEALEAEHLSKRSQLRRDAINKMDDGEMKEFEDWWDSVEELDKVNFKRLREQSDLWGKAYVQKVALAASKDLSEIEKMLQEHKKKIDKILQEGDDVKKVTDAFKTAMDDLDMIFALREEEAMRTAALGNRRVTQLMEWSKKAYSIGVEDLKREMQETSSVYHDWFVALGDDQDRTLQAMLVRLRQYHDDMDEVVRKAAKEHKRLFDMVYYNAVGESGMTRKQEETATEEYAKRRVEGMQRAQGWGYGGDNLTNNAELNLISLQIEQKLKYIDALRQELVAKKELNEQTVQTMMLEQAENRSRLNNILNSDEYSPEEKAQAMQELADLENQLAQKRQEYANIELETNVLLGDSEKELMELRREQMNEALEHYQRMFDYLKEMQGNMDSFAESFGQGIFGSKEDRAQAARDLLTDVLKTTKNVAQAYLIEIATKKVADQAIVAMEQQKQAQLQAQQMQALGAYGATKVAEMTVEGATTTAKVTADTAKGIGTEVAKHGLKGLAIGAAISAALSLLLGLAMGAINKSKSAISSATGATNAGKLATGMLTYAKGRYPVYADGVFANDGNGRVQGQMVSVKGNDGVNYMAKYQPNLQTGVVNGPHLGIVGEKGAEVIIDHGTYEGLKRYDPETLRRIYAMKQYGMRSIDFSRTSRMGNEVLMNRGGVRAYADGNINEKLGDMGMDENGGNDAGTITQMQQTLAELTMVLGAIKATGIPATVSYLGANGAQKQMEKGDKFLQRVGLKKV